jgi:hypothetical protein
MATKTTTSANDTLVDLYIERAVDLLRLEAGTRNKVLAILADLEGELVGALAKVDPTGVGSISAQRKRLAKLLEAVRAAIRAGYRDANKLMAAEIREIVDQEATWTGHAINTSIDFEFVTGGLTRAGLETIASDVLIQGAASSDWWSRQAQDLQNRFTDQMRLGIAAGETNADLIARVRGKAGQSGVMDISENSATRLVRTSVQAAANAGREAMYDKNSDIIESLAWHATLDTRTSIWCITRDGHHYSNDDEHKPKDGGPPWLQGPGKIHWCCRSDQRSENEVVARARHRYGRSAANDARQHGRPGRRQDHVRGLAIEATRRAARHGVGRDGRRPVAPRQTEFPRSARPVGPTADHRTTARESARRDPAGGMPVLTARS